MTEFDYILVGGGLQSGLLALALRERKPSARIALIEASDRIGGNHTWSFHSGDVPPAANTIIQPLITAHWPQYDTRFPNQSRRLNAAYSTISSDRFADVVSASLNRDGCRIWLKTPAVRLTHNRIECADGTELSAKCVIDSRGPLESPTGCGYQKFIGWEIETDRDWPESAPVVMDATVPQIDGFHFFYTLPFTKRRILVEDTYFSDSPQLDRPQIEQRIRDYLSARVPDWRIIREESGVLPMPWRSHPNSLPETPSETPPETPSDAPIRGGYAGGWFHPATGYSFPVALRFALAVADVSPELARNAIATLARRLTHRWKFARLLNRLLFCLVPPESRWQVFARLYRTLPPAVFARFYSMEFAVTDAARILIGRPPQINFLRLLPFSRSQR
ncbi:lycopene beta-cyclase CrtY [Tuwongella immobilis]|uniref:Lycopene cyclase n=1 Tax=Tuwongella immobilis TaxID=692036 RepID=A0A6C2YMB6_9BACT|nr:lycopene beta-cyclase CrtY [Tuwongella immobilis]VIP02738.1 lycopene cyclase : CrtY OS=uncultured bacterium PE=4 SV=1: Lycopene_cycl [Tuwongella immobilis]VTS02304.1 lycopene cyclase : CrtY OS=uncultured bacterium PE=4 SV=1: Lycopene_cycl [Tuwongella immobilis]